MIQPTVTDFKKWALENQPLALVACAAKAHAQTEKDRVDAYILPIFEKYDFRCEESGEKITNPVQLYLVSDLQDDQCTQFYADCDKAHQEHGFEGEEGFCPALMAHHLQIDAERVLIHSLGEFFGVGERMTTKWEESLERALTVCLSELV